VVRPSGSESRHLAKLLARCKQCREVGSRQFSKLSGGLSTFRLRVADRKNLERVVSFRIFAAVDSPSLTF